MLIDYQKVNIVQDGNVVLKDVDLQVNEGDFVYIIGKVGAGKSSLLKTLYCELDHSNPEKAEVLGRDVAPSAARTSPPFAVRWASSSKTSNCCTTVV